MKKPFSWEMFNELPLIAILRGFNALEVKNIVKASCRGGLKNIEITMNTDQAPELIQLAKETAGANMNVGAGTVCTPDDLEMALGAGAQFIVMPIVQPDVIATCRKHKIPVFPGAFTPTEIYHAWQLGGDVIKVFPAHRLAPGYLKDIKGPLAQIKLLPTGGITPENMEEYYLAGADGFGIGSALANKKKIAEQDWDWISQQAKKFVDTYKSLSK